MNPDGTDPEAVTQFGHGFKEYFPCPAGLGQACRGAGAIRQIVACPKAPYESINAVWITQ
jgi:hypothetical protein